MDNLLIIVLIIAVIVVALFFLMTGRKNQREPNDEKLQGFPYEVQNHFLSPAELSFFQILRSVVGNRVVVCSKVGLGDVFRVKLEDKSKYRAYRNKIDRKHVDFLLCDSTTMRPIVGIELDDKSHERPDRQERDAFVDQVFKTAGLSLLHIPVKRAYVTTEIATQLEPFITPESRAIKPASVK